MSTSTAETRPGTTLYDDLMAYTSPRGTHVSERGKGLGPTREGNRSSRGSPNVHFQAAPREVFVQCPKCKTMETLQVTGGRLLPCRKFSQRADKIFHDCGSTQPCQIHR